MARKRKADQEAGPSQRRGRGSSDLQTDAEPAEQDEAAAIAEEDDVAVEIEDADDQVGNQRREEWAALARRYNSSLTPVAPLHYMMPFYLLC